MDEEDEPIEEENDQISIDNDMLKELDDLDGLDDDDLSD